MMTNWNFTLEHQVSPWKVKFDHWMDDYNQTIKNKILVTQTKSKIKAKLLKKKLGNFPKKDYFLAAVKSSKQVSPQHSSLNNRNQSESLISKMKKRLKTINTQQGINIQNSPPYIKTPRILQPQTTKHLYKKSPAHIHTSFDVSPQHSQSPQASQINQNQKHFKIVQNFKKIPQDQYFMKRQGCLRSLERLKSHKKLKLPKIQMCILQH